MQRKAERQGGEERGRKLKKQKETKKIKIKSGDEEKGVVEVSNTVEAAEQYTTPVAMMSHLLELQRLPLADRGPSWPC